MIENKESFFQFQDAGRSSYMSSKWGIFLFRVEQISCIDAHLRTSAITLCAADYTCNRTPILEVSQPSNCASCQSTPETQVSMATVVKSIIAPDILNTKKMWFLVHIRFVFFPTLL